MALTFPLAPSDLVDLMLIETVTWTLGEDQELSGLGSGEVLARDLGPRLWAGDASTGALDVDSIEALRGRFHTLDGAIQSFYLYDPQHPFPSTDPTGAILLGSNVTISNIAANRKEISFAGLPAGFALPMDARFSVTALNPSRTALIQLAAPITANGGGFAGPVEVRPHLRPWLAAGQTVQLRKPVAKVKLVPKSLSVVPVSGVTARLRFSFRQTLAAG
ncbi:hypothetical protein [Devosia sp.]|uniref:hypothetical protein n=1 Tax=Devosia sp. TaxID=1871048 RepID=UPI001AD3144F|nr:hypothetical protein [Devosia sp.]MBN9333856.1 hypothetical protein [Devosia sp.]